MPTGLRCLSSKECRVCKKISDNYEGCVVTSTTPVCDSDDGTTVITTTDDADKTAKCVGCKNNGKFLGGVKNYLYKHIVGIPYDSWNFPEKVN